MDKVTYWIYSLPSYYLMDTWLLQGKSGFVSVEAVAGDYGTHRIGGTAQGRHALSFF